MWLSNSIEHVDRNLVNNIKDTNNVCYFKLLKCNMTMIFFFSDKNLETKIY